MEREKALENAKKMVSMLWKKENLQYGKGYAMHFVSLSKIRDFGNRSAWPVTDTTISNIQVAFSTSAD